MEFQEREELIIRNAEEVIGKELLVKKFEKEQPIAYCGYEISGEVHLGHLVTITKLIDFAKAGVKIKVLLADWHSWLNQKGTWEEIAELSKVWEKAMRAAGLEDAEMVIGSHFQRDIDYIDDVMKIAQKITLNRALRSMQQVARNIEEAKVSQVIYPLMQIVDIKYLNVDIVEAGIEQRKIHMLGLEVFEDLLGYEKPVFVHTPLIPSLKGPGKMSSSDPDSLISVRDQPEVIKRKINKAYCPEGVVEENPILMIARLLIFPRVKSFIIRRPEKYGGDLEINDYKMLEELFKEKKLHPQDLKQAVSDFLVELLKPIRTAFGYE